MACKHTGIPLSVEGIKTSFSLLQYTIKSSLKTSFKPISLTQVMVKVQIKLFDNWMNFQLGILAMTFDTYKYYLSLEIVF